MLRSTQEGTSESTSGSVANGYDSSLSGIHSQRGTRPQSMFEPRDPQKHHHWQTVRFISDSFCDSHLLFIV